MSDTAPCFEATSRPRHALGPVGLRVVLCLLALGFTLTGVMFLAMGAWPVLGFVGIEFMLVIALFAAHRRHSARAFERVTLRDGRLLLERTDHRGISQSAVLDAYWARVRLQEGLQPQLSVTQREAEYEIGLHLGAEERRDLARRLEAALARHRTPVFDNPQLRG
ncbi:MAG: DUF2244 domain-containing protein [Alphaproteobacteria bacterium]|nr:DUF2244 domain-containing protein [Alphaproteobacteria bacterium]